MTPITNQSNSNSLASESAANVFDINRFSKTPKARHYARRAATKTAVERDNNAQLGVLVAEAKLATASPTFPEYKTQSHQEILAIIDRVNQTAKLLDWMRHEEIGR